MLQWFIRFPAFAEFTEFVFHSGKSLVNYMYFAKYCRLRLPFFGRTQTQYYVSITYSFRFQDLDVDFNLFQLWLYHKCVLRKDGRWQ